MSDTLLQLASGILRAKVRGADGQEMIEVTAPASTAASFYEKVRTAVDYQEEHLLRRNAILRILKRFLGSDVPLEEMSKNLLRELIWARYLPNKEVPAAFAKELIPIFLKYEPLFRWIDDHSRQVDTDFQWVLEVMSTEIEYAITPPIQEEALVSYMYQEMRERIFWDPKMAHSEEEKDLMLYIAVHKALLKSNVATLRFRVMVLYYPDWPGGSSPARIEEVTKSLDLIMETVDTAVMSPVTEKLSLMLRRKSGVFWALRDVIVDAKEAFPALLRDPEALDREVAKALKRRTKDFRTRLQRTIVRSVMFLFITKMFLALLLEVPYDLLIVPALFGGDHKPNFWPLLVNICFHPLFLAFIAATATIPEKRNENDYKLAVRALNVGADHELINVRMKQEVGGAFGTLFGIAYAGLFFLTYGFIGTFLVQLSFSVLSIGLFLFFLSLVTFFGIRIRSSTKDVVLSSARSGVVGSLFDAFMLPIVQAGRWLSLKVSKINIFIYFFDFIIESPYKVAVRFIEGWVGFIREKKEEI